MKTRSFKRLFTISVLALIQAACVWSAVSNALLISQYGWLARVDNGPGRSPSTAGWMFCVWLALSIVAAYLTFRFWRNQERQQ